MLVSEDGRLITSRQERKLIPPTPEKRSTTANFSVPIDIHSFIHKFSRLDEKTYASPLSLSDGATGTFH